MPSGAKKRKAAKKKKEKETHNGKSSTDENPQGNNEVTSQDEKGSDGGEVGSTAIQEHHNQQDPFKKSNEELGERGPSSVQPVVSEDKSGTGAPSGVEAVQKVGLKNDDGVRIERELKQDSASKNVIIEHAKSAKGSHNGDDRSSSSSSSDDESELLRGGRRRIPMLQFQRRNLIMICKNGIGEWCREIVAYWNSCTSRAQVSNHAESSKNPDIPEYSEKQPLVAPAPPVPRKISWFSCCGILEVITGSSR
ncbi:uncharacterized protein Pyn_33200 [Prunus yedoensis var. nudiflora]|uniref:Uncharacterized protein n=1 Tax=Prunus yedoensis var. nudiflora TaxID=2094558 RepID=A0A314Y7L7_PRUYE|nr:uncharacterized protein Pyn_33200 [Prunus yedoensis var. nudiflora]